MILTLPKKFNYAVEDIYVPLDEPMFKITLIIGGILLYNINGGLIAQIFVKENTATATVADGASLKIERKADGFSISHLEVSVEEKKKITRPTSERLLKEEYILFGKPENSQYQIFEKKPNLVKPDVAATVIPVPLDDNLIRVKIEEGCNVLRILSIILSISLL